jgi:hypothetical protein
VKFCQGHWDKLRRAIDERGMSHLIAADEKRAVENLKAELESGRETLTTFDPLMGAHWAIVNRVTDVHPEALLVDGCPLCYAKESHAAAEARGECPGPPRCAATEEWFEEWISSVADHMKSEWVALLAAETSS